ncbi:MAG: N-acetylmuramoyl-L-alanine amidase [Archangium sp.]|nr:N-acetylmuramoyl-L-alanine amidase [Archangium sp.]
MPSPFRLLSLCLAVLLSSPTLAAPPSGADEAYQRAKDAYQKLRTDEGRRKFRHHWLNVAKKFEGVATKYPKSERAAEALYSSGDLYAALSRFSMNDADLDTAQRQYEKVIKTWPKHRLADDAGLALARLLSDRRGNVEAARTVASNTLASAGAKSDKKRELQSLLAALPAPKAAAKPRPAEAPTRPAPPPSTTLADATRKTAQTVAQVLRIPAVEMAKTTPAIAARAPVAEAEVDTSEASGDTDDADAVVEGEDAAGGLTTLQEKLRDVRVGPSPGATTTATKARFTSLAKKEASSELSLAQQLGLKVRRVVIDAGHGGHDTGAIGPTGVLEKDASLAMAKKLAAKLEAMGLEVTLTRDDDTFVTLEDRTKIANRAHGDLFISVHCNAAASKNLRGVETYTLNTSSNRYAIRLAARENATTERGVGDLQYILADLATKANTSESSHLAERVQKSLIRTLSASYSGVRDLGTKEALFFVLLGAKMPAILVETSFISNPEDEKRLADDGYQQSVADAVADAVDGFLEARNKVAQID